MTTVASLLFFIGLIVLLASLVPLFKDLRAKKKKASPKGLGMSLGGIVMVIIAMVMMPSSDSAAEEQPKAAETQDEVKEEKEDVSKNEDADKDDAVDDNEEKEIDPPYTKDQEGDLLNRYTEIILDTDGLILNIDQEDNYNQIYVRVSDDFKVLPTEVKQSLIDDWGNTIENNTRSRLFQTGSDDFLYVYFLDGQGNYIADTGHLDRGWTVREP